MPTTIIQTTGKIPRPLIPTDSAQEEKSKLVLFLASEREENLSVKVEGVLSLHKAMMNLLHIDCYATCHD